MNKLPANLPKLLRDAGLTVVEIPGWQTRGRPASTGGFSPVGVLWHHTGSPDVFGDLKDDLAYAKWLATVGRSDLPAPLCQLSISVEGVVYVCAAGRANHAGKARASGPIAAGDGNKLYVGVECQNSGSQGFGKPQLDAMVTTGRVLSNVIGCSADAHRAHRETSVTGKWDPGRLDMPDFRHRIGVAIATAHTPGKAPPVKNNVTETRDLLAEIAHELDVAAKKLDDAKRPTKAGRDRMDGHAVTLREARRVIAGVRTALPPK